MAGQIITIRPKGPYLVRGNIPLVRVSQVITEYGEPIDWKVEDSIAAPETYRLCRCGQSNTKPFCDGTHTLVDFDGTETADSGPISSRQQEFKGERIVVKDDHSLCAQAGYCANRLTDVWQLVKQSGETGALEQIIRMVQKCPSGTLAYIPEGSAEAAETNLPKQVAVISDGPLWVRGSIPVIRRDGKPFETRNRVTLCRCGASANKPLCDGSHRDIGFTETINVSGLSQTTSSAGPPPEISGNSGTTRVAASGSATEQSFTKAALTTDLAPGEKKMLRIGDEWILLVNLDGEFRAVEGRCSHASVALVRGQLEGERITCPLHKSIFGIKTGEVIAPPASRALKVFPVRIDGEQVLIGPAEIAAA